nr:glycosyltransferase family 4 protein [Candidatus Omnitrophota bacterium]
MNIGIDIRSTLKRTNTGIGRYTLNLIKAISKIDQKNNYYLYSRKKLFDFKKKLPVLPGKNFRHARGLSELDIFHTSSYDLVKPRKAGKFIVTIHDVIIKAYPYGHSEKTIKEVDEKLKRVSGEADLLIADSHNTKSDIIKFYNISDSKIKVIYPGVDTSDSSRLRSKNIANIVRASSEAASREQYILFIGTIEPRKNIQGLIKAFNLLRKEHNISHKLIIAGMKGWMYEDIFKEYENSAFKNDIIFKGYVSDQELAELYKNASVFVYPSFYEGFGFPILEAFGHGVPVITSKTSSCGEIAGDSALLVNPERYQEIAEAVLKIINSESLRQELVKKGLDRAKEFTWQNTAIEFLNCLTNT